MFHGGHDLWGIHMIWWIFWFIIIFGSWGFFRAVRKKGGQRDNPLDILKRRFANGEISKEEYAEKRRILEEGK